MVEVRTTKVLEGAQGLAHPSLAIKGGVRSIDPGQDISVDLVIVTKMEDSQLLLKGVLRDDLEK